MSKILLTNQLGQTNTTAALTNFIEKQTDRRQQWNKNSFCDISKLTGNSFWLCNPKLSFLILACSRMRIIMENKYLNIYISLTVDFWMIFVWNQVRTSRLSEVALITRLSFCVFVQKGILSIDNHRTKISTNSEKSWLCSTSYRIKYSAKIYLFM